MAIQPAGLASFDQFMRAARNRLFAYLGQAPVFVHGYNASFDNTIRRAGQPAARPASSTGSAAMHSIERSAPRVETADPA